MLCSRDDPEQARGTRYLNFLTSCIDNIVETLSQPTIENILADRNEGRSEKRLPERHERDTNGDFITLKDCLSSHVRGLVRPAVAEPSQDLEADEPWYAGGHANRGREAGADRVETDTGDEEGGVVADLASQDSARDCGDDESEGEAEEVDTAVDY